MGNRSCRTSPLSLASVTFPLCRRDGISDLRAIANSYAHHMSAEASQHAPNPARLTYSGEHSNTEVADGTETPSDHSTHECESEATRQAPEAQDPGLPLASGAAQVAEAKALQPAQQNRIRYPQPSLVSTRLRDGGTGCHDSPIPTAARFPCSD